MAAGPAVLVNMFFDETADEYTMETRMKSYAGARAFTGEASTRFRLKGKQSHWIKQLSFKRIQIYYCNLTYTNYI